MSDQHKRHLAHTLRTVLPCAGLLALTGCGLHLDTTREAATYSDANRPSLKAARGALAEGEAQTALAIANGVLVSQPHNAAALVAAGDAQVALNNRIDAAKSYRDALAAQPGYLPARLGVGKMKLHDDVKGAEADFRAALASQPKNTAAMTDLGVSLDMQERHKDAQAFYTAALTINPDLTAARVNLALSMALAGEAQKAEGMLAEATQSSTVTPRVRADFAVAQVMAGHSAQAEATLQADLSADEARASVAALAGLLPPGTVAK
jgi:tetratricopeptide (TPR) repeat protein